MPGKGGGSAYVDGVDALEAYGYDDRWAAAVRAVPGARPGRVVRHDGVGLLVATHAGIEAIMLTHRLAPPPTVGDWVAIVGDEVRTVVARTSLLRRHDAATGTDQALAANVDVVFVVCGLDRPVKQGRIERTAALAFDAGATPVVVLTKADLITDADLIAVEVAGENPGFDVVVTGRNDPNHESLRAIARHRTVVLVGESGAGKSSLVNTLAGHVVAETGAVRTGDAKGRHTTTARELHLIPTGGCLVDSPGIRAVGLVADPDAVDETLADVLELALACRFSDCGHTNEPGCAILAAIDGCTLAPERLDAWRTDEAEAAAATRRASEHERRQYEKQFSRLVRGASRRKRR